jgi:UDPglucose--hexose-1-phosphate uridylyltransferase
MKPAQDNITQTNPHRRRNALTGEWMLVSPHRNARPWQGAVEKARTDTLPAHDDGCYLCAGNTRANGETNKQYRGPWAFTNDFPALTEAASPAHSSGDALFQMATAQGEARVVCYSERHDLTMARLETVSIRQVIDCWIMEYNKLAKQHEWVAIFENKGAAMGCSNPHPHGQIWASDFVPNFVQAEDREQRVYHTRFGQKLLLDYARREVTNGARVVFVTEHWLCVVPYWAVWPFEALLVPLAPTQRLTDLTKAQKDDLASSLKNLTVRYDNLFQTDFPYSMGWHGAPCQQTEVEHWQLHAHFFPPLLRSATVKKFMVGYEMLAEAQRDLTPETAAAMLRMQNLKHYLDSDQIQ